jgi:hypothetical protein
MDGRISHLSQRRVHGVEPEAGMLVICCRAFSPFHTLPWPPRFPHHVPPRFAQCSPRSSPNPIRTRWVFRRGVTVTTMAHVVTMPRAASGITGTWHVAGGRQVPVISHATRAQCP